MKILAIDTSSKNCSVSIVEVQENKKFNIIAQENSDDERTHSVKLMPMVDDMLKKSNLSLNDIDLLACCLGPGSFTGIRIGIATIKAFADAKNIPTVGVTSLESLAYNIKNAKNVCSIIDCKHNNVYCAAFSKENEQYNQTVENISNNIEKVLDIVKEKMSLCKITFVGDGSILYKELIEEKFAEYDISFAEDNIQSGISLAKSAYFKFIQGKAGDSNNISPLYLRKSQAELLNKQ